MDDITFARQAAARAQNDPAVASMILSGRYDAWPNVAGALNALKLARGEALPERATIRA